MLKLHTKFFFMSYFIANIVTLILYGPVIAAIIFGFSVIPVIITYFFSIFFVNFIYKYAIFFCIIIPIPIFGISYLQEYRNYVEHYQEDLLVMKTLRANLKSEDQKNGALDRKGVVLLKDLDDSHLVSKPGGSSIIAFLFSMICSLSYLAQVLLRRKKIKNSVK